MLCLLSPTLGGCVDRELDEDADPPRDSDGETTGAGEADSCDGQREIAGLPFALAWLGSEGLHVRVGSAPMRCDSQRFIVTEGETRISFDVTLDATDGRQVDLTAADAIALITPGGPSSVSDVGEIRYLHGQVTLRWNGDGRVIGAIDENRGHLSGCFVAEVCEAPRL